MQDRSNLPVLPIVVLSGYLGAGKTSFLNQLLAQAEGQRIAVLVNDFGSINVDADLIEGAVDGVVALQNGCICCSMAAGLQVAIFKTLKQDPKPELILIEASGVSNPGDIARILGDEAMQPYVRLELVVAMADCEHWSCYGEAERQWVHTQIKYADVVLLTKTDIVDDSVAESVTADISRINPGVLVFDRNVQDPSLDILLGQGGVSGAVNQHVGELPLHGPAEKAFQSWVFKESSPLNSVTLNRILGDLPEHTVRGKGSLYLSDYPSHRFVFQMVGKRVKIEPSGTWGEKTPGTEIVFIALKDSGL